PICSINSEGDITYETPLRGVEVYPNYLVVPEQPTYEEFKIAYLRMLRNQAADKFKYSLAGNAPLNYFTDDSPNSVSDNPNEPFYYNREDAKSQIEEKIKEREESGFYKIRPFQRKHDENILHQYDKPCYGWSCIFSNTNSYGKRFSNMSNLLFEKNPYGFQEININNELERGDIIQLRRPWINGFEGIRPFHATMFNSYSPNNDSVNVYDNHGYIIPKPVEESSFVLDSCNFHSFIDGHVSAFKGYKFMGDEQTEKEIKDAYNRYIQSNQDN
ncbi:MAG: hypothetical protein K2G69_06390, partial [Muribaculaceae bacterium]|nr:hypothetical protein [Muribaculaceae bacterium]